MYNRQQGQGLYIPIPGFPGGGAGPGAGYPGGDFLQRLNRLERQVDRLNNRMDRFDRRLDRIERQLGIRVDGQPYHY